MARSSADEPPPRERTFRSHTNQRHPGRAGQQCIDRRLQYGTGRRAGGARRRLGSIFDRGLKDMTCCVSASGVVSRSCINARGSDAGKRG